MATNLVSQINYDVKRGVQTAHYLYNQASCQVTHTNGKIRIYRIPNHDGRSQSGSGWDNWGGCCIRPLYLDSNLLQKGHTYIITYYVEGVNSDTTVYQSWTNNMGWGGGGLNPAPSNVKAGFNGMSSLNGGRYVYYKFTINDDVYKVCTSSYSSFVQGQTYPSYRDFIFGFTYSITDSIGTDVYVSNWGMYDVTNGVDWPTITRTGDTISSEVIERMDGVKKVSFDYPGHILTSEIYEN